MTQFSLGIPKEISTFAVVCLGCKVNRAEVDAYSASMLSAGMHLSDVPDADVIIVNTCTVTHVADKKTRQMVRRVCSQNANPNTIIIVTGCAAFIQPNIYLDMDKRIQVIAKHDVLDKLGVKDNHSIDVLKNSKFRTRASIKIQDGCNNNCTYCIVHTARGKSVSVPFDRVLSRFQDYLNAGYREVVLSGVNLGSYLDGSKTLVDLLKNMLDMIETHYNDLREDKIQARIRLSSIEPQNVSDDLIDLMASADGRICRHLHMPLQSGSSKVLKEMNRHYDAKQYLELVDKIRGVMPQISLSTDVIVGFPGETQIDFDKTLNMARECGFTKIHVFPYSKREGTPAAARTDQVDEQTKSTRASILRDLSDNLAKDDKQKRIGHKELALAETKTLARTESYHRVECTGRAPGDLFEYSWD